MFFKIFGLIKFHNYLLYSVYACEMSVISWIQGFCEFPLAVFKLLLLAPLLRTLLQKFYLLLKLHVIIQFLTKMVWKLKTSIFKNPFTITFLFQICSKQCAMNWLIGKCHTCEIWSVSPGAKWKSHFLCGAALCCVESWLEGVLVSTNCAAFYSACVCPSRNCPSVCLSHTTVVFRDLEKVHIASDFSHKSSSLWLILPSHFGMGMWHRISHCRKAISPLLKKSPMNRSFMSQKQPQYTVV